MDQAIDSESKRTRNIIIFGILLTVILIAASFLRFRGLSWGEYQYLHPDERFLIWVGSDISPVNSLAEYWDTANSSLNPHNRGHGFYVYGTLPMYLTRYAVEWVYGQSGFNEMTNAGRFLSALADLLTVLFVYFVAAKVYNKRVGLLAASFSAFAVLQIQHSHFFTVDTFTTLFAMMARSCTRASWPTCEFVIISTPEPISVSPPDSVERLTVTPSRSVFSSPINTRESPP